MRKVRRLVFVVSPSQKQFYESLKRTFAEDPSVEVVLDRRKGERRQRRDRTTVDRRRADRRRRPEVDAMLASRGYAVIGVVAVKTSLR